MLQQQALEPDLALEPRPPQPQSPGHGVAPAGGEWRCRLEAHRMREAAAWIARYREFWERQFDALEKYLEETEK